MTTDERIATALERIADAIEYALSPEPEAEQPSGCPHPDDMRSQRNGWAGFHCAACDEMIGAPIARTA